jgi:RNA polymerase sigma factor (sigma-70 family)
MEILTSIYMNKKRRGDMHIDDAIIKKAANGDIKAYGLIVEAYGKYVYSAVFNIVRDHHETEYITQDVFIKAYYSLHKYRFKGFTSWIGRIAVNKAIDRKRELSREYELRKKANFEECLKALSKTTVEDEIIYKEEKKQVKALLKKLPQIYRKVIYKYYYMNKSYRDIANEEKISIKTVESRLYRARKLIKEKWEEESI